MNKPTENPVKTSAKGSAFERLLSGFCDCLEGLFFLWRDVITPQAIPFANMLPLRIHPGGAEHSRHYFTRKDK
jgi:hypothetical protein